MLALLELLGRRWALRILWELRQEPASFQALQARCDSMSTSVLSQRLGELRDAQLVEKDQAGGYRLTEPGTELLARLDGMDEWTQQWGRLPRRHRARAPGWRPLRLPVPTVGYAPRMGRSSNPWEQVAAFAGVAALAGAGVGAASALRVRRATGRRAGPRARVARAPRHDAGSAWSERVTRLERLQHPRHAVRRADAPRRSSLGRQDEALGLVARALDQVAHLGGALAPLPST